MRILFVLTFLTFSIATFAQTKTQAAKTQVVEAACGQCMFAMEGKGCDLAVRIDGKTYWVDGTGINDHGDAHAADGFCNAVRKAEIKGAITDKGRYKVEAFKLVTVEENKVKSVQKKVKG